MSEPAINTRTPVLKLAYEIIRDHAKECGVVCLKAERERVDRFLTCYAKMGESIGPFTPICPACMGFMRKKDTDEYPGGVWLCVNSGCENQEIAPHEEACRRLRWRQNRPPVPAAAKADAEVPHD